MDGGGFKSNNYVSHSNVVNAIIGSMDKFKKDTKVQQGPVNVFASIPYQTRSGTAIWRISVVLEDIGPRSISFSETLPAVSINGRPYRMHSSIYLQVHGQDLI